MLRLFVYAWGMITPLVAFLASTPAFVDPQSVEPKQVWLDSLDLSSMTQDWKRAGANRSVDGNPISVGGKAYQHGVGTHAVSEFAINLAGNATLFHAMVGVDDEPCGGAGSVVFVVIGDDKELGRTPVMHLKDAAKALDINVTGVKTLTLLVEDGGDGINYDHADWADALIVVADSSKAIPASIKSTQTDMPGATGPDAPSPHLNYPRITGASPKKPFLFRIPASGKAPLVFSATGLPEGLKLDESSGVISGSLAKEGEWTVNVGVINGSGKDSRDFTIIGKANAIALTPPMGWNSWNCWAGAVDQGKVQAAADRFVSLGLAAHGYQYVNIDDTWEAGRDKDGKILGNEKFPDMHALAENIHGRGLKLGIYSSPGPKTCAGFEGRYKHELLDAQHYAAWGVDYLKYDWCSYGEIDRNPNHDGYMKPYIVMRDALRAQPRDILFSLCQYGMGDVWKWGKEFDGNCWRTTDDINDSWHSMAGIGFSQADHSPFASPGHWNDPDMLVVGKVGWGPSLHPTKLTHNEQITHMSLWAMLASPLLIGCDLTQVDEFTLALLTNDDILSISQDPLGKQATRLSQRGQTEIWARPMVDGSTAVAFFNRGRGDAEVSATLKDLGLTGTVTVRDAWMKKSLGTLAGPLHANVPSHAAMVYILTPAGK